MTFAVNLKFSEMLNIVPVSLFIDKSCHLVHWMELWIPNCNFAHIWSCCDHNLWPTDLKCSEMLNTARISLFIWQNFPPVILKWSYGSQTELLPIFGHVMTLTFGLCPLGLKFKEMLNTAPTNLFHGQKLLPDIYKWSFCPKTEFLPIFGHKVNFASDLWNPKSYDFIVIS